MESRDKSDIDTWNVTDLFNSVTSENPDKKRRVLIPKYQRNLVWGKDQKESFIESLKKGFPFGSLLLYKVGSEEGIERFNLIDGLQRTTTIINYVEKPTEFFSENDIEEEFLLDLFSILSIDTDHQKDLVKAIISWVKEKIGFSESVGFSSFSLASEIAKQYSIDRSSDKFEELYQRIIPFLENVKIKSDISGCKIPVVIYYGEQRNLPIIFEKINSKGTQLNKYQIFAATWANHKFIQIDNTDIIKCIKAKYDALIDEGLTIENYNPDSPDFFTSDFNYFEYIFGLGKHVSQKYPHLFGESSEEGKTDSIGFNLCTACLCDEFKDMNLLPEKLDDLDVNIFEKCLLETIDDVFLQLKPFIYLKANKKINGSTKIVLAHSEYQIVSLIAKVFTSKYNQNLEIKGTWPTIKDTLLANMPMHYLYDILREEWRGSGDSKIKQLLEEKSRYNSPLYKHNWENILNEWFETQLLKKEKTRSSIKEKDLLFLKYIYAHFMSSFDEYSTKEFHIDHIVSIAKLKEIASDGIPMSAISNLCLIEKEVNLEKKEITMYQYFDKLVSEGQLTNLQAEKQISEVEKYTFTKRTDLEFVEDLDLEKYNQFLKTRFLQLKEIFYDKNRIVEAA